MKDLILLQTFNLRSKSTFITFKVIRYIIKILSDDGMKSALSAGKRDLEEFPELRYVFEVTDLPENILACPLRIIHASTKLS